MMGMGNHKGDITIGQRMAEEVERICKETRIKPSINFGRKAMYEWRNGKTPGGFYLARLHSLGGDVIYVLTGRCAKYGNV